MNKLFLSILCVIIMHGCELFNPPKIVITKEYIINEFWNEKNNSILIEKLDLVDTTNISKSDTEIIKRDFRYLEVDSSYIYIYNAGEQYNPKHSPSKLPNKKLFFNEFNNGFFRSNNYYGNKYKTIGTLENDTWYKFSNLRGVGGFFVYVYVDNTGEVHKYIQDLANY